MAYGFGAVVGRAAELLWQPGALLLPVAAVVAVVVLMAARNHGPRSSSTALVLLSSFLNGAALGCHSTPPAELLSETNDN